MLATATAASTNRRSPDRRPPPVLAEAIKNTNPDQPTAFFVDLPPTSVLPATVWLNQMGFVVVPIIPRWVAFPSVLSCVRLLDQLVIFGERCRRSSSPRAVVFVLDGEREGRARTAEPSDSFDNRYVYSGGLFPSAEDLQRRGFCAVRWVTTTGLTPDLQAYAAGLAAAGLGAFFGQRTERSSSTTAVSQLVQSEPICPDLGVGAATRAALGRPHAPREGGHKGRLYKDTTLSSDMARYRRFVRRAQTRALLADNLVLGEPYLALDPVILGADDDDLLHQLTRTFASAFDRGARRLAADVTALEEMGFPWVAAELLQVETPRAPIVGRFDFVRDESGAWWLLEFNADTPSGVREAIGGEEALLDVLPALGRYDRPSAGLRAALVAAFDAALPRLPTGATLGLVASAGELEDIAQVSFTRHLLAGSLAARGARVVLGDVDNLRPGRTGLHLGRERIDALYRCFSFESTFGTPAFAAIYDAVASGRVILLNGLFGLLLQHKGVMSWLWAHRDDPELPAEERQVIQRHLPPTWNIAEWAPPRDSAPRDHEHGNVVKQVFGREGEEVYFGDDLTPEQWDAFRRRRTYVVQRRIAIAPHTANVPTQCGSRSRQGYPTFGSFVVDGAWGGYYTRFGDQIVNARAKWLATLAEPERAQ
jgi:glutathionylspermidine synthase